MQKKHLYAYLLPSEIKNLSCLGAGFRGDVTSAISIFFIK